MMLIGHINPIEEPRQWLPIAVLVWLVWQWRNQVRFWIDKEHPLLRQVVPDQLRQLWFAEYRRILFLVFLSSFLSWALLFS